MDLIILPVTDVNDIKEIMDKYVHEGGGIYRSPLLSHNIRWQIPEGYVRTERVVETPKPRPFEQPEHRPVATHRVIEIDEEMYVELPGGTIPLDEWKAMTHTGRHEPRHRPHHAAPVRQINTRYSAGESQSGRPVIKHGRRTIEWGFKSTNERDSRLRILIEVEQEVE